MRVLHLFDTTDDSLPHARLALLAQSMGRLAGVHEDLCLLGNHDLEEAARTLNLQPRWRLGVAGRKAVAGYFSLRRAIRSQAYDLIHCWSAGPWGSGSLAMLAAARVPRVVTVTHLPTPSQAHWARMLSSEAPGATAYLPITAAIGNELLARGVPQGTVHVLYPAVDMGLVSHHDRQSLRDAWGVDRTCVVVIVASDPPESVDCVKAHMAAGLADQILRRTGQPVCLVVHPQQVNLDRALVAGRALGRPDVLIADQRIARPWEILPGCDIALAMGTHAAGLHLLWAMAANVPIVGEATPAVCEIVEDRHSALLAKPELSKALSHRITQVARDKQLAWKLKDTARHEAYSLFSRQHYVQSIQQVYQQIASHQPVEVPAMPSTGGLRFAGRG